YRSDWLLENVLVFVFFALMWQARKHVRFSNLSYLLMFIFLFLHEIGSHYTYAEVPYDAWFQSLTGHTFNALVGWERNHFDRVIHFLYGVLLMYPVREFFVQLARLNGFWSYFFPFMAMAASSVFYEQIEWAAAEIFGGELGMAYLGTQGDIWDGHKDMGLASLGALLAISWCAYLDRRKQAATGTGS
ncbi:MAG: DUF2238 domain-containing protein, partial [Thioalkalispiraceae bacterium]